MRTVTLQQIMDSARQYADMQNSNFIQDSELIKYINNAALKYWNLINELEQDYNYKEYIFTLQNSTTDYPLPADFLYLRGVDINLNGISTNPATDNWSSIDRFMLSERNTYRGYGIVRYTGRNFLKYDIIGQQIRFIPIPTGSQSCRLIYTPVVPDLVATTDTIDGINGFEDYIAMKAAERMLAKEESDTTWIENEIMEFEAKLKRDTDRRNRDRGDRVSDINTLNEWYQW